MTDRSHQGSSWMNSREHRLNVRILPTHASRSPLAMDYGANRTDDGFIRCTTALLRRMMKVQTICPFVNLKYGRPLLSQNDKADGTGDRISHGPGG
jgi:hypothetical protein